MRSPAGTSSALENRLHGRIAVPQRQKGVAGCGQDFHAIATQPLGGVDIVQSLLAIALFGVDLSHESVDGGIGRR